MKFYNTISLYLVWVELWNRKTNENPALYSLVEDLYLTAVFKHISNEIDCIVSEAKIRLIRAFHQNDVRYKILIKSWR